MALDEYRRKRDFTRSPEPTGDDALVVERGSRPAARHFCVQKHLATQLHYDLRLEHRGVLLSWAVPKGPSLDPTVKRLAMQVEDHPLEYGDFEGVIPEGYGAGVVMLWDSGTWEPESPDVDAALAKGELKLRLNGFKLKGSWALVRTHGWGGRGRSSEPSHSWLLIKHRDDWSGPLDITEFAPLSVKSEADFPAILEEDAPRVWTANPKGARGRAAAQALTDIVARVEKYQSGRTMSSGGADHNREAPVTSRPGPDRGASAGHAGAAPPKTRAPRKRPTKPSS